MKKLVDLPMSRPFVGNLLHEWCEDLFPINRSITGEGLRETLAYINMQLDGSLSTDYVESGKKVFDWTIPQEWNIREAWIKDENSSTIADFSSCNLHVVGYSEPVNTWMSLDELQTHIHSLPDQPTAVPYVTSYYKKTWGFCLADNARKNLKPGMYHVYIDSAFKDGRLDYGEFYKKGRSEKEVFLSTYICHPSMANNELSGPVCATAIAQWLKGIDDLEHSYRIAFVPETIGALAYLHHRLESLKKNVIAGLNITCVGDDRAYSYLPSRKGNTYSDTVAQHVLRNIDPAFKRYSWLDRGSDERQYCSPGIDLPIASIMRTKYGEYPEYHTSLDDLQLVTPTGLNGGYWAVRKFVEAIEMNIVPIAKVLGEPQLGVRGLYDNLSIKTSYGSSRSTIMLDLLSYSDGSISLLEIADLLELPIDELYEVYSLLKQHDLIQ